MAVKSPHNLEILAICKYIKRGCGFESASVLAGIHLATAQRWLAQGRTADPRYPMQSRMYDEVLRALEEQEAELVDVIREKAVIDREWKAAAWLLSRTSPGRYGDKIEVMGKLEVRHEQSATIEALARKILGRLDTPNAARDDAVSGDGDLELSDGHGEGDVITSD